MISEKVIIFNEKHGFRQEVRQESKKPSFRENPPKKYKFPLFAKSPLEATFCYQNTRGSSFESSLSLSQGFSLLKDRNSSLDLGYSFNIFTLKQGESAGVSGDGSDRLSSQTIYAYGIDLGLLSNLRNKIHHKINQR